MSRSRRLVEIVEYDHCWPRAFRSERARIIKLITHPTIWIEHIGSTAVPGLAAKPIIDIMVGVPRLRDAVDCISRLAALGYRYVPAVEVQMPYRRFLCKEIDGRRTHHLHIIESHHGSWNSHLIFRDYLRSHPAVARDYEQLKRSLALRYRFEIASYTQAKSGFVVAVLRKARLEKKSVRTAGKSRLSYEKVLQAIVQTI